MSNAPYTTDKLVRYLMGESIEVRARETFGSDDQEFRDAIIARLRAGENLLDMMRLIELRTDENGETWFSIFNEGGRSALINITSHGPIVRGAFADFEARRKNAIAEFLIYSK